MNRFNNVNDLIVFIESQRRLEKQKDLSEMYAFCEILGNPQNDLKCIHVTGTNGKGSVVQYLKDLFINHNFDVATFTSPYIVKFNERICHNNNYISDKDLLKYGNMIIDKYDEFMDKVSRTPSFFEFITLLAFLYFKSLHVDLAIIEVGIGGLIDSTNVINSLAQVIVNVSYDHMNILGNTLPEILIQKLGITRCNTPLITGIKDEGLLKVINDYIVNKGIDLYPALFREFEIKKCDLESTQFILEPFGLIELKLLGYHQIENAVVALTTFEVVMNKFNLPIDNEKVKKAMLDTTWPARLEVLNNSPYIIIDGAHNEDGIRRICDFFKDIKVSKQCIFACSDNKEKEKMIYELEEVFEKIIITEFTYKRHTDAKLLFENINQEHKLLITDINEAIDYVFDKPQEVNLFVGSLYFTSEIRPIINQKLANFRKR